MRTYGPEVNLLEHQSFSSSCLTSPCVRLRNLQSIFETPQHTYISCFSLLANEIIWRIVRNFIDCLPKEFREARQKYYATFELRPTPKWKTCNALTDEYFTHATTLLYFNKRVTKDAVKKVSWCVTDPNRVSLWLCEEMHDIVRKNGERRLIGRS